MRKFFLLYAWEIVGAAALLLAVLINIFPAGHIIMGGDVVQTVNVSENLISLFYEWFGRVGLFYLPLALLDFLGVSDTTQLSWYLGFFLLGAYGSFLVFAKTLFRRAPSYLVAFFSVFYAANIYTLYIFTTTWGFTQYQILYVFIPAVTGLYIRALQSTNKKYTFWFFVVAFLMSVSFGNPAFAVSMGLYMFLLTVGLFLSKMISWEKKTFLKIVYVLLGAVALNAYWLFPSIPQMRQGVQSVVASTDIDLESSLRETSNALFDTFRLVYTHDRDMFYPYNWPYPEIQWPRSIIITLALVPFFVILFGAFRTRAQKERRIFALFLGVLAVFIVFVAKVRFPFASFNNIFFQLPGINVLRGYDKVAIFIPFLFSALLFSIFLATHKKKYAKACLGAFAGIAFLLSMPFFTGGIQTRLSYILRDNEEKDFRTAGYRTLIELPEAYYNVQDVFKEDPEDVKIAALPFSPGSAVGRVKLPGLHINAPHFAHHLYSKVFLPNNDQYIPGWVFSEEFYDREYDPQWIVNMYGLLGVKYIIYHKDAPSERIERMEQDRTYLENTGAIRLLEENDSFYLYCIEEGRVFPFVYGDSDTFSVRPNDSGLYREIEDFHSKMAPVEFEHPNPLQAIARADSFRGGERIFLNEKENDLWRAVYRGDDGTKIRLQRDEHVNFANAWIIPKDLSGGEIEMYHYSLPWLWRGVWVTGAALAGLVVYGGLVWKRSLLKK